LKAGEGQSGRYSAKTLATFLRLYSSRDSGSAKGTSADFILRKEVEFSVESLSSSDKVKKADEVTAVSILTSVLLICSGLLMNEYCFIFIQRRVIQLI
jgi:hypothetical protein